MELTNKRIIVTGGTGFLGREAVEKARAGGPRRRLVSLVVPEAEMIWGGELVLRDGAAVGQVTSGAWGEAVGGCVGLAYVRHPDGGVLTPGVARAGDYQVNVGGTLHAAAVSTRPPFDPAGDRIKGRYPGLPRWLAGSSTGCTRTATSASRCCVRRGGR